MRIGRPISIIRQVSHEIRFILKKFGCSNESHPVSRPRESDGDDFYRGPVPDGSAPVQAEGAPDEKQRQAYFWIVNKAIVSPHYDIEYNDGAPRTYLLCGRQKACADSAFLGELFELRPAATADVRDPSQTPVHRRAGARQDRKCDPDRRVAGAVVREVRRAMQHGHSQMTAADLLGNPLPADLINAESMGEERCFP